MSAEQMLAAAVAFAVAFIVTLGFGKKVLSSRKIEQAEPPPAETAVVEAEEACFTRQEEIRAWSVVGQARELFPDLDLELMKRQVHP